MRKDELIFQSTGVVMRLLEKIFSSNLKMSGVENIPDAPILFVANHFTRAETFILPYMLYRHANRRVRSLSDDTVFVGALGKYLESLGTVSLKNPNRNQIILGDLITGRYDWLVYPEGMMVKNKHVIRSKHFMLNTPEIKRKVYTGSAVMALKTELIKKEYLVAEDNDDCDVINKISQEYFIGKEDHINPKPLYIVPITINFFPIRPGSNPIYNIAQRFVKNLPERIKEELEIEGNLITNSEMIVYFGKAINIYELVKSPRRILHKIPFIKGEIKNNLIINYFRHRITNKFMERIYHNTFINFDHIFSAIIFHYPEEKISEEILKRLIYISSKDIKKLEKYNLHHSIDADLPSILSKKGNKYYKSIKNLALTQNMIKLEGDHFIINHQELNETHDFHLMRVNKTVKLFINDMFKFHDICGILKKNTALDEDVIKQKTFEIALRSQEKEYFSDYQEFYSTQESKSRKIGMPFFLKGDKKVGVLLSHGYKAAPEEVRILAEYLNEQGFNVYAPRLKGHGTSPINMKYIKWQDWYQSFLKGYLLLKQSCDEIVVAGFSTGGLLALLFAATEKEKISSIISINSALKLNDIKVNFVSTVNFWNEMLTKLNTNKGKKEFVVDTPENPHINYSKNYLKGVGELSKLMERTNKHLKHIKIPSLVIQGKYDPIVNPKSGKIIYGKIASKQKKLITPDFDNHVIIKKKDAELFKEIKDFIVNNLEEVENRHG